MSPPMVPSLLTMLELSQVIGGIAAGAVSTTDQHPDVTSSIVQSVLPWMFCSENL